MTVFGFLAGYFWFKKIVYLYIIFSLLFFIVLILCLIKNTILSFLYVFWMKLGGFLGLILSPIISGTLFFFLITPLAIILRLLGRDELHLKATEKSFWITHKKDYKNDHDFKNQF